LPPTLAQEIGSRLFTRIEGRRIKHYMNAAGVKVDDKFSRVLRVDMTPSAMTRQLRRLRGLGLIKKVTHTYRYYLTRLGRAAIAAACSLTRFNNVPGMAAAH
jgi:DNA-binding HxlR family transcriptional regulator